MTEEEQHRWQHSLEKEECKLQGEAADERLHVLGTPHLPVAPGAATSTSSLHTAHTTQAHRC